MTAEEVRGDYELETGNVIVRRFADIDPTATPAVLVKTTDLLPGAKIRPMQSITQLCSNRSPKWHS